jgi:hypothetical protein
MLKVFQFAEQMGALKAIQQDILDILDARFGKAPDEITSKVLAIEDLEELRSLHKKTATIPSVEEFAKLLATPV